MASSTLLIAVLGVKLLLQDVGVGGELCGRFVGWLLASLEDRCGRLVAVIDSMIAALNDNVPVAIISWLCR